MMKDDLQVKTREYLIGSFDVIIFEWLKWKIAEVISKMFEYFSFKNHKMSLYNILTELLWSWKFEISDVNFRQELVWCFCDYFLNTCSFNAFFIKFSIKN